MLLHVLLLVSIPPGLRRLSCAVQGPKFKIPLPTSFVAQPHRMYTTYQVSSTSSQRSRMQPYGSETVDTARTTELFSFTSRLSRDD